MEENCLFLTLPQHLIVFIFSYCDQTSLGRLSATSRKFNVLVNTNCLWLRYCQDILFSVRLAERNSYCCKLSAKQKCGISYNWKNSIYRTDYTVNHKIKFIPWLQLTHKKLWLSVGEKIISLPHNASCDYSRIQPVQTLSNHDDDVSRFVVKYGLVVSAGRDGAVCAWKADTGKKLYKLRNWHGREINCVDVSNEGQVFVTGSKDRHVRIGLMSDNRLMMKEKINIGESILSLCVNDYNIFVGSAGRNQLSSPLFICDMLSCKIIGNLGDSTRRGAGILDVHLESNQTLLSCGYDAFVRLWDIRTHQRVMEWEDPYDSTVYCIASDDNYMFLSGTSRHGLVRLWDKRMSRCLQLYYVGRINSPVYSLGFDPCHMFVALDRSLKTVSFSGENIVCQSKYRKL